MTYKNERITKTREVVGFYEVSIEGLDKPLKVKVEKYADDEFVGVANLEVKGNKCADFYRSLTLKNTKEEAFEDAIRGFFAFYSDEAEVREVKDW